MGALGSDAAIEAADVVLMDDDPVKIAKAIRIAKKCMQSFFSSFVIPPIQSVGYVSCTSLVVVLMNLFYVHFA